MSDGPPAAIFHIVRADDWAAAVVTGEHRPASLAAEGFVHCSFGPQVAQTLDRHYPDRSGLVVVELDPAAIAADLVVEDSYGRGTAFPHVYGPLPTAAAVAVHAVTEFSSGSGSASTDR